MILRNNTIQIWARVYFFKGERDTQSFNCLYYFTFFSGENSVFTVCKSSEISYLKICFESREMGISTLAITSSNTLV